MTRAYDFVVAGVITIIAAIIHRISVALFAPDGALWAIATDGTGVFSGTQRAALWFEILTVWVPLLMIGGIWAWALVREYRRQRQTVRAARAT